MTNVQGIRIRDRIEARFGKADADEFAAALTLSKSADYIRKFKWAKDVCNYLEGKYTPEQIKAILEQICLASRRDVPAGVLTYAEQRALEIGITIAGGAQVILLDEPTAGMSRPETENAVELIRTVSRDRTLVMVEHDMSVVFGLADRISVLVYGEIVASDTPERIRASEAVRAAYLGTAHA
jgi:ABC-type branched-subunit amino acid transport system ATPase component